MAGEAGIVDETSPADGSADSWQDRSCVLGQPTSRAVEILAALDGLQGSFDSKIKYDEAKERQIEALHQELQGYRQGLYRQILQPILADLISIYDEVAGQLAQGDGAARDGLGYLLEMVEMSLDRHGAAKFTCEGDVIDRSRQRVLDTEPTADAELGKKLARRLRPGFEFQGKVLRPEWVVAYRHAPDAAAPSDAALLGERASDSASAHG